MISYCSHSGTSNLILAKETTNNRYIYLSFPQKFTQSGVTDMGTRFRIDRDQEPIRCNCRTHLLTVGKAIDLKQRVNLNLKKERDSNPRENSGPKMTEDKLEYTESNTKDLISAITLFVCRDFGEWVEGEFVQRTQ